MYKIETAIYRNQIQILSTIYYKSCKNHMVIMAISETISSRRLWRTGFYMIWYGFDMIWYGFYMNLYGFICFLYGFNIILIKIIIIIIFIIIIIIITIMIIIISFFTEVCPIFSIIIVFRIINVFPEIPATPNCWITNVFSHY